MPDALELTLNNKPGCTYITRITLGYDKPEGPHKEELTLSGGLARTVGNIPRDASNLQVQVAFLGVTHSERYTFSWPSPVEQWPSGRREIEMTGVWPGQPRAVEIAR